MSRILCVLSSLLPSLLAVPPAAAQPAPIVGGSRVPEGKWNDVVAVIGSAGSCSGTLIAPDVVLTAGHCIEIEPYEVVTSTIDFGRPGGDHIAVKWARAYPDWASRYDVGVLMLEHMARPAPRPIAAACHTNARLKAGAPLTIVGYGLTTPSGIDDNTRLHEATAPVVDPFCEHAPGCEPAVRPNGELSAGGRGTDSCFGDSGGPAFLDTPAGPALVGVVSRGLALPGQPCGNGGIYVRADKIIAWAQGITDRKFLRTTCAGERDDHGDDPGSPESTDDHDDDGGGCSAAEVSGGGGAIPGAGLGLAIALAVIRRRRQSETSAEPVPASAPAATPREVDVAAIEVDLTHEPNHAAAARPTATATSTSTSTSASISSATALEPARSATRATAAIGAPSGPS